ncbi:MAG: LysR family transcriptional regulator [Pseudomonadota bacterium]
MSKALDRITLLETFVRIAEAGSISAAARDLGLSQPSASRQLNDLETRLNTQLVRRTTHSLALTEAGGDLLRDARQLVDGWEALAERHRSAHTRIEGKLKVFAPVALGQQQVARIACDFQARHPGVTLSLELDDRAIRFAEEGCDCWIKVGPVPDDTLIVRPVGRVERLLVAAPQLLPGSGRGLTPGRVEGLPMVSLDPFEGARVPLSDGKRERLLTPDVRMRTNNIFALKEAALAGIGMAILPKWFIAQELREGHLVDLLPRWRAPWLDIQVAYLPARQQPLRLREFLNSVLRHAPEIDGIGAPLA